MATVTTLTSVPGYVRTRHRTHHCGVCGRALKQRNQKYCAGTCRVQAYRMRMYQEGYIRTRRGWKKRADPGGDAIVDRRSA